MDRKSGHPFWAVKNGLMKAYPRLEEDIRTDIVVVGGGITGALIADELSDSGKQVVVIEQREVGWGSTAASTALVQYEIDTHMVDLAKKFGEARAALAYLACAEAIPRFRALAKSVGVALQTDDGLTIRARHVVLAACYANQTWLKQKVASRSSYAFVSDPVDAQDLGFLARGMVWESARPYLYLRSTGEGRVIVGGEDDPVDIPGLRDLRVEKKGRVLMEKIGKRFPSLPLRPAFAWAGTFAETEDGLPFFGPHEQYGPRVLFAMAYGGNGITYGMLGAGIIRAVIERRKHRLAELFSFERIR